MIKEIDCDRNPDCAGTMENLLKLRQLVSSMLLIAVASCPRESLYSEDRK